MTSSQHNSDERDLLDFADAVSAGENPQPVTDLELTYLHVHQAMQGTAAAIPSTTKQSTWEDVMSTVTLAPDTPVSNRTRRTQPRPLAAFRPKRLQWTPLASIAAALLVILASFGVWFTSGREEPPIPPVEPRQVAGLTPGELLQIATPTQSFACDFTHDMPIISASESLPIEGTYLVWQEGGDLILRCEDEVGEIVLASGIYNAGPVEGIPGTVTVYMLEEGSTDISGGHSVYINITTGDSFTTGNMNTDRGFFQQSWGDYQSGPFLFVNDEDGYLVILDTRTMTATPIGELFGENTPESFNLLSSVSDDNSTMAIMLGDQDAANSGRDPMPSYRAADIGAEGDVLLLNTESGETHWLTVPTEESENLTQISLSPDASMLAVSIAPASDGMMASEERIMIVSTEDGAILAESEYFESFDTTTFWADSGLVVQTQSNLLLVPFDGTDIQTLYNLDSATGIQGLLPTLDPNVFVITSVECEGECRLADSTVNVVAVDISTGETTAYSGQNVAAMTWIEKANLLLMSDPSVDSTELTTFTAIDPVSGEIVAAFNDIPGIGLIERQMPLIGPKSIGISSDGETVVVAIGMQYMIELKSDGATHSARMLPVPGRWADDGTLNSTAAVFLSADGTQLSAMSQQSEDGTRYLLDLTDPEAEWVTVETTTPGDGGYVLFVEGVPED